MFSINLYQTKPPGMQASILGACPKAGYCEGCVRKGIWRKNGGDGRDVHQVIII